MEETVRHHLSLIGSEAKVLAKNFVKGLLRSGVKASLSGDLWSDSGMGLFGIYAHGINYKTWDSEKKLIGLVACASERHTADNIEAWTQEALEGIGLTPAKLLAP